MSLWYWGTLCGPRNETHHADLYSLMQVCPTIKLASVSCCINHCVKNYSFGSPNCVLTPLTARVRGYHRTE